MSVLEEARREAEEGHEKLHGDRGSDRRTERKTPEKAVREDPTMYIASLYIKTSLKSGVTEADCRICCWRAGYTWVDHRSLVMTKR